MASAPTLDTGKKSMILTMERVCEVSINSPIPQPYTYYQAKDLKVEAFTLTAQVDFYEVAEV